MERICTHCGTPLEDNALFCPECGERVTALPAADDWLEVPRLPGLPKRKPPRLRLRRLLPRRPRPCPLSRP